MKRIKRRLSLTLRGSQTIDESLSELAEQMTVEENSSKDSGECRRVCSYVCVCSFVLLMNAFPSMQLYCVLFVLSYSWSFMLEISSCISTLITL